MENNFTATVFEKAYGKRCSICQVGLVRIENGITMEQFSAFVQQPKYSGHCPYRIFAENLISVYLKYRIPLNHHDALRMQWLM